MRLIAAALLVTLAFAACGSEGRPRDAAPTSVVVYAATTDRLCSDLAGAIRRAFSDAPADAGAALARYARDVAEAGRRFAAVPPPPDLVSFHDSAIGHVREEAAKLRRVAQDTKAGDTGAQERALRDHQTLLPRAIPATLLAYAPTCRALSPDLSDPRGAAPPPITAQRRSAAFEGSTLRVRRRSTLDRAGSAASASIGGSGLSPREPATGAPA